MSNIIQSGGFLDSFLSKVAGALIKVAVPIAKYILDPLGIKTAAYEINAVIKKKKKKKKTWFRNYNFNNFKWKNEWRNEK